MTAPYIEALKWNLDDKVKISTVQDLKDKLEMPDIPDSELKEYFDKPFETTKRELSELRQKYMTWSPKLDTIKTFLIDKKNTILDDTKKRAEELKKVTWNLQSSVTLENLKNQDWKIDWQNAEKWLVENLAWMDVKKVPPQELSTKLKQAAPAIVEKWKEALWWAEQLENNIKGWWLLGALTSLFLWILNFLKGIFWGDKKKEVVDAAKDKVGEKVDTMLSNIDKDQTKVDTKKIIIGLLPPGKLTPETEANIDTALKNISEENLIKLSEKIKKWELTPSELSKFLPDLMSKLLTKEQVEKTKKDIQESLVNALKKEIKEKYNIELDENKMNKLKELVEKNTNISNETIWLFNNITNKKELLVKDFFGPGVEAWTNSTSLMLWLLVNWIIPISAFWMDFVKSWTDIIKLSIDSLWIWNTISMETFNKNIDWMNDKEKAVLIWLLYRKWWLFLWILWNLSEFISRIGTELITKTEVKWYNLLSASVLWDNLKQVENFEKIAKALWWYKDEWKILEEAINSLKKVQENYTILDTLTKSEWNTAKAISELEKLWIAIPVKNPNLAFDEFAKSFKNNVSNNITDIFSKWSITSKFWFWANADLFAFSEKLENITKAQRMMFDWNFLTKWIAKLRELGEIWSISRLWDRMVLHFESEKEAIKWISKWNVLANKFPELVKWCLDKLPIIAIAWISANSDKPFFEEFAKEMKYLFPIVWPIWLVGDSWLSWEDGKPKIINWVDAWIGWALLTLDSVFLIKEITTWWLKWWLSYMIKPIKDIYSLWRWTAEWIYSVWKSIWSWKSISWVFKESLIKSKSIKNAKLRALAVIWFAWYIWYKQAFGDDIIDDLSTEDWKIDPEKLKKELPNLSDEDKKTCLIYILGESLNEKMMEKIEFRIINNKLYIVSNNENVQSQFIVDNELLETLWLEPKVDFTYNHK